MAFYKLIAVVFAVVGYTNGYTNDLPQSYEERNALNYGPTTLYVNEPPPNYNELQAEMDKLFTLGQEWVGFKHQEIVDDSTSGEDPGDQNNCGTTSQIVEPYVVKINNATENTSYTIVQTMNFRQRFRVTTCKKLDTPCMTSVVGLPKSVCKNKLGSVSLYVYDETNRNKPEFVYKRVDIPVCCSCMYEK